VQAFGAPRADVDFATHSPPIKSAFSRGLAIGEANLEKRHGVAQHGGDWFRAYSTPILLATL
jgi:hypothetical protein